MDKIAAHGPMIPDDLHGTYYRVKDVDAEIARMLRNLAEAQAESRALSAAADCFAELNVKLREEIDELNRKISGDDFTRGAHDL